MTKREKIVLAWSGGKDSSLALWTLLADERYEVVSLLTTISRDYDRISHHGVRTALLDLQADALGLPVAKVFVDASCNNDAYEDAMKKTLLEFRELGVRAVAFGDIFLQDLREYRESNLARVEMTGLFPIWQRDTTLLAAEFVDTGFKAYLSCVDGEKLGKAFAGRAFDHELLRDLPDDVDSCGENGEFHSFVYDGPIFPRGINVRVGETVQRDVRFFTDLLPADSVSQQQIPGAVSKRHPLRSY